MLDRLDLRLPVTDIVLTAALLDPRCCNLSIVLKSLRERGHTKESYLAERVRQDITEAHVKSTVPEHARSVEAVPLPHGTPQIERNTAQELLALSQKHSAAAQTRSEVVDKECSLYLSAACPTDVRDNDLLRYWRQRKEQYPWLATLARKYLCIQATSTCVERVFNITGLVLTSKKNRTEPGRVNKIVFVHENYDECKQFVHNCWFYMLYFLEIIFFPFFILTFISDWLDCIV